VWLLVVLAVFEWTDLFTRPCRNVHLGEDLCGGPVSHIAGHQAALVQQLFEH
jgi:hypothetical protein